MRWIALTVAACAMLLHCSSGSSGSAASVDAGNDASMASDTGPTMTGDSGGSTDDGGTSADARGDTGSSTEPDSGGPTLGGCPLFAPQFAYNVDISDAGLDPNSATYLTALKASAPVIGLDYPGGEIYNVVPASQAAVPVQTGSWYGFDPTDTFFFEADAGGATAPIPTGVQYENMTTPNADHHMMVLQQGTCSSSSSTRGTPRGHDGLVGAGAVGPTGGNEQIPDNLEVGSTTAAGTPLLARASSGPRRWRPARSTTPSTSSCPPAPSRSATTSTRRPTARGPRPEASLTAAGCGSRPATTCRRSPGTQALVVLRALQKYGMFNTDISGETRSSFRLGGIGNSQGWVQTDISQLGTLTWDDFDVVDLGTVHTMAGCH